MKNSNQCSVIIVRDGERRSRENKIHRCCRIFYKGDISVLHKDSVGSLWMLSQHAIDERQGNVEHRSPLGCSDTVFFHNVPQPVALDCGLDLLGQRAK